LLPLIEDDRNELGTRDKEKAILMTGAIAQAREHAYGGIARWFVEEELRGKPEDFRCANCQVIGCRGDCFDGAEGY
jgi:hypothetical protein